jgi:hypothetical protein
VTAYADDVVGLDTYTFKVVDEGAGSGATDQCHATHTATYIADRVAVTLSITYSKLGLGQNCSGLLKSGIYQYDSSAFDGSITLNSTTFSYATAGYRGYTAASVSGGAHGVTAFTTNSLTVLWQNVTCTWSHFWTRYSEVLWFAHIDLVSMTWSVEGSTLPTGATVLFYENSSIFTTDTVSSGAAGAVHDYGVTWRMVAWTLRLTYVAAPYNVTALLFYAHAPETVPCVHTIYPDIWLTFTDLYLYISWATNWHNASLYLWDNVSTLLGSSAVEGITQIVLPTVTGLHMFDILINGSSPHAGTNTGAYPTSDYWRWYHLNFTISVSAYTTLWMTFTQSDGVTVLLWGAFHVYVNTYQCPQSWVVVPASSTVNITVADDFGVILYQNLAYPTGATSNTFLKVSLTVYPLIINNRRAYPQDAKVTRSGVDHWIFGIAAGGGFPYLVYTGTYTVCLYKQGEYATPTDPAYTFTVTDAPMTVNSGVDIASVSTPPFVVITDWWALMLTFGMAMALLFAVYKYTKKGHTEPAEPPAALKRHGPPPTEYERRMRANEPAFHQYDRLVEQERARRAAEGGEPRT